MKAAADVIAHAAERHRAQRAQHHLARVGISRSRVLSQQEQQLGRPRELRRRAEAAETAVERVAELLHGPGQRVRRWKRPRRPCLLHLLQLRHQRFGRLRHLGALVAPHARDFQQDVDKSRPSPSGRRRKVRTAVKRFQIRCEPHAHRPAAAAGRRLHERHVDAVDVGPLLPIDFDRDEVLVEHGGDVVVLERLVLHHVAPVTRRVADREEDRFVVSARFRERLVGPREPVDRIVRVLEQVGAARVREPIHRVIMTLG